MITKLVKKISCNRKKKKLLTDSIHNLNLTESETYIKFSDSMEQDDTKIVLMPGRRP